MKKLSHLLISIAISEGVGFLSSLLASSQSNVYESLTLPSFAPPGWIFGPVWIFLYALMGIAAYRVFRANSDHTKTTALVFYCLQLFLNFMWSIIFFRWHQRGFALLELILLFVFILITTYRFYKLDKIAGYLMFPYVIWTAFAIVLNYSIWMLNK